MSIFSFIPTSTTILAREIKINESPAPGDFYFYVDGDKTGFFNWLLKVLNLKDPSIRLTITDSFVTKITGKKHFGIIPTSQIHNFESGFSKNTFLLVIAIFLFLSIFLIPLALIFLWLYSRSGAMLVSLSTFNGMGNERIRIKSGITGKKLDKENFEQLFAALQKAVATNSQYYRR